MKVQIITIGDEIIIGQIVDTNSAWMARQLNDHGAQIVAINSVRDEEDAIKEAITLALPKVDAILLTGGLGPTKDDITKKTLADLLDTELVFHEPTYNRIVKMFQKWGRSTTPAHKQQCYLPADAQLLFNKMGTAPGMWFEKEGKIVVSMPGIPYEMKYLMEMEVIPKLKEQFPGKKIIHRTILTVGEGESRIAAQIEDIEKDLPDHIKLAFLPNLGKVRLRLSGVGEDATMLEQEVDFFIQRIEAKIPELVFGYGEETLEGAVGDLLKKRQLTLSTAESCTGGYLAHKITSIPGSSAYFQGSVIAYANAVKINQLGVSQATLDQFGAVSEQTVKEMVSGLLKLLQTDIGIAISGIAGPGGGSPEKPVGTIWIAVGNKENIETIKIHAGKDRMKNIQYASVFGLNSIRKFVLKSYKTVMV